MGWRQGFFRAVLGIAMVSGWVVGPAAAAELEGPQPSAEVHTVRTATVEQAPAVRTVILHGVTRAADRATVAFTVAGRLARRPARLGASVEPGDVLAVLDAAAFDNRLRVAKAAVADLEARRGQLTRERTRLEAAGASFAESELDRIRTEEASVVAALEGALAQADEAARQRREAVLRAPFPGVVRSVEVEPGESVVPGQAIVQLAGVGGLEVEVQAPEGVWARLEVGAPVEVRLVGIRRTVPGQIRSVAAAAGPSGLLPVVVTVDDPTAVPGLTAEAVLGVPIPDGVTVPLAAIVDPTGGHPSVFLVQEDTVSRVPVRAGELVGERVVVWGDLDVGHAVVVSGQSRLLPGDAVEVVP